MRQSPLVAGHHQADLKGCMQYGALASLYEAPREARADTDKPTPAESRRSVTPEALISFIDAKPYKTPKRHLTKYGLDPYSYRDCYGLPKDYPMVAANYAAQRSELAKNSGLGRLGAAQTSAEA